eukprot:gene31684-38292_t
MYFSIIFLSFLVSVVGASVADSGVTSLLRIRGGKSSAVDEAKAAEAVDYYDQFHLDYGCNDNVRIAGSMRGFIRTGSLSKLPQSDAFIQWLQRHLESGPEPFDGRVKPCHVADFGTKKDLKKGENPKLIIVKRMLEADPETHIISPPNKEIDVEVREIWQPWLKPKCDFVVRYVVPNRVNICKIMEAKRRFKAELEVNKGDSESRSPASARMRMVFRPSIRQRLLGKRDAVIEVPVDPKQIMR